MWTKATRLLLSENMRDEQRRPQQTLCATNKCPIVSQYQTLTFNVCARLIREHMSMIKILKPSLDLFWSSKLQSARKNQRVHINNYQQNHRHWALNSHPVTRGLPIVVVGLKTSPWLRAHCCDRPREQAPYSTSMSVGRQTLSDEALLHSQQVA